MFGNDPSTALCIALADQIHVDFSLVLIVVNCLYFLVELLFGREMIGIGTFVNWFFVGPIASWFTNLFTQWIGVPSNFLEKLAIMAVGVVILSFSCALYQTADVGISPYDSLSLILAKRGKPKYFWCRIFTDSVCVVLAFLLGGLIGLGTLVCALGLGPFISFFTKHAAEAMVRGKQRKAS